MTRLLPRDGRVVVAGASLAGLRAAQTLREEGFVGSIVMVGEEPHLPYDRPPLSKQVLAGTWPPERTALVDAPRLDELGIDVRLGRRAVSLDAGALRVTLDDGEVVEGDGIVVATGARARQLPGAHVLRTVDDALSLRQAIARVGVDVGVGGRVVVVGAGFIGAEVAATCAGLGCRVTVLEALAVPLAAALGEVVGAACGALHERHGVELRTRAPVMELRSGAPTQVVLDGGEVIAADVVVVGIGVDPNAEWLEGSVDVANGVVCDHALFAAPGVVAAGDVARWTWRHDGAEQSVRIEHWEVASQMGVAAARSLLAGPRDAPSFDPVPYFWSDQYGLRIQVLGRPEPADDVVVVDGRLDADDGKFVAVYGRAGRLSAALAVSRPRQLMAFRPLLEAGASFDDALALLAG